MKANELMIGDLVQLNGSPYVIEEISKKGWVHMTDTVHNLRVQMSSDYILDFIEGIPLTEEILEANGFELLRDTWYFSSKGRPVHIRFADDYIVIIINGDHVPMKLRYVHQLHHALHLCGIEKEIIVKQ